MSRHYDFIIFGATGFTGQYVAEEVSRIAGDEHISWAVAGRNVDKMKTILENVEKATGKSVKDVGVIKADVGNPDSLAEMAKQGKIVLNCVGPYRFYGEAVVKACIDNRASHIDISGEPQFLERMQLEYHGSAQKNNVYVVGACGFDSIPAEMGILYLERKFNGQLNSVESYLSFKTDKIHGHYGTWQSAIYIFGCAKELKILRKKLFPVPLPELKPKLKYRAPHFNQKVKSWCLPLLGPDPTVVRRSQRFFFEKENKRPIQMKAYVQMNTLFAAILMIIPAALFALFASFKMGRTLLEKYPTVFSFGAFDHEGPTKEEMEKTSFALTLVGRGWSEKLSEPTDNHSEAPKKEMVVRVSGPEPGYIATPICMVHAAIVILQEPDKLPLDGGVLTPGVTFAKTSLIERLQKHGLTFEIIDG